MTGCALDRDFPVPITEPPILFLATLRKPKRRKGWPPALVMDEMVRAQGDIIVQRYIPPPEQPPLRAVELVPAEPETIAAIDVLQRPTIKIKDPVTETIDRIDGFWDEEEKGRRRWWRRRGRTT